MSADQFAVCPNCEGNLIQEEANLKEYLNNIGLIGEIVYFHYEAYCRLCSYQIRITKEFLASDYAI